VVLFFMLVICYSHAGVVYGMLIFLCVVCVSVLDVFVFLWSGSTLLEVPYS
jgi:hypothetical protein